MAAAVKEFCDLEELKGTDGVDLINVYSKGQTVLGRTLSNFARIPFVVENEEFASVEAWWYWRQCKDPELRGLSGPLAKSKGSAAVVGKRKPDPTPEELAVVYRLKLEAYVPLKECFLLCTLPFDHYYVYNGEKKFPKHRWTGQLWNDIHAEMLKEQTARVD